MALEPDSSLDRTEAQDSRLFGPGERRRLAMRVLKRIDYRQKAAQLGKHDRQRALYRTDLPK
eukprot:13898787-Alexandrium_andersonii.AAC.1